jgi:hypothetical protein
MKKTCYLLLWILCLATGSRAATLYIPMNADDQNNHLKAYGIAFIALKSGMTVDWLINYDGGAFAMQQNAEVERLCRLRGVDYNIMSDAQYSGVVSKIADPNYNGDIIKLEKPPRIAVSTPPSKLPWDDAVTMALTSAEIP